MKRPFLILKLLSSLLPIPLFFNKLVQYRTAIPDPETGEIVHGVASFSLFENLLDGGYLWLGVLSLIALGAAAFLALSSLLWSNDRKVGVIGTVCWVLALLLFAFTATVGFSVARGF